MKTLSKTALGIGLGVLLWNPSLANAQGSSLSPGSSLPAVQTAAVSSVGYADVTYAAEEIYKTLPAGTTSIVIYDANSFSQMAAYEAALSQIRLIRRKLCRADQINVNATSPPAAAESFADLSGLTGVANFIQLFIPTYNNASTTLQIPQSALVAAMVNTIRASNSAIQIIVPSYVLPSLHPNPIACNQEWQKDNSFTNQWAAAAGTAESLRTKLADKPDMSAPVKKVLQDALTAFDDFYKALTVSSDKSDSLLPHLLA
jgi:hypothetical protein